MKTNIMQSLLHSIASSEKNNISKDGAKIQNTNKDTQKGVNLFESLKNKNVQDVLKTLLSDLVSQNKSNKAILETLKNEPIFKEFKSFSSEVKTLIKMLENSNIKPEQLEKLKNSHIDIKNIDNKVLKQQLSKSGVFLESYLKNLASTTNIENKNELKQNIINDMKATLLGVGEELKENSEALKQNNKLLNQIEYYQLYSLSDNSNHNYLPFSWDDLEDGDINFKQTKEDSFSCVISLNFKYYGDVKINLILDEPNKLAISFFIQQEDLKEKLQKELQVLRKSLKGIDIDLQSLYLFDYIKQEDKSQEIQAYTAYNKQYGVDIKV